MEQETVSLPDIGGEAKSIEELLAFSKQFPSLMQEKGRETLIEKLSNFIVWFKELLDFCIKTDAYGKWMYDCARDMAVVTRVIKRAALADAHKELYYMGYFSALADCYRSSIEGKNQFRLFELGLRQLEGRKYIKDTIKLLYYNDMMQNKKLADALGIRPNQLNRTIGQLEAVGCVTVYVSKKFRFYRLTKNGRTYVERYYLSRGHRIGITGYAQNYYTMRRTMEFLTPIATETMYGRGARNAMGKRVELYKVVMGVTIRTGKNITRIDSGRRLLQYD